MFYLIFLLQAINPLKLRNLIIISKKQVKTIKTKHKVLKAHILFANSVKNIVKSSFF